MELIETILFDKELKNFEYHLKRVKKTFNFFKWRLNINEWLELKEKLNFKQKPLRVRVTYNQFGIKDIELFEIKKRDFNTFKIVEINFNYPFKFKNRKNFEKLKKLSADEFILIKNNLITDTTISNLAFFTGKEWITPASPLLFGTKRAELIDKGILKEEVIKKSDLRYFKKFAMINAILGFYERDIRCIKF